MVCGVHELSIAQAVLDQVTAEAVAHGASRIVVIRLEIGELAAVVPEALDFSFGMIARGTAAEGARIEIAAVPWRVRCRGCGAEYRVEVELPICPTCGAAGGDTLSGKELRIMELDIE